MKLFTYRKSLLALCLTVMGVLIAGGVNVFASAATDSDKWWESITPEGKLLIIAFAVAGIAVVIVYFSVLKPKMPGVGKADFTLKRYEEDLRDKVAELKVDLQLLCDVDSPESRKISAALKEAEQRLFFIESGYADSLKAISGLAEELEILRGWVSETEIESAESMLASGDSAEARSIWTRIAEESGVKRDAYARREADAYFHLGLLAKNDLDYDGAMDALIKGIETGKAGVVHVYEAGQLALIIEDYWQAEALFKQGLGMACDTHECTRNIISKCQTGLGDVFMHSNKFTEALPLYESALAAAVSIYGEESIPVADGCTRVAQCKRKSGDHDGAAELCRRAFRIYSNLLPDAHPKFITARKRCKVNK
ncbi:tetratricopeptide repeat protein [Maridesulfovibrio sp.]|uniref:tetratricopeptide repeat protein n=1 Tax=Maridesulfovibrio sp. TaxID=2795000 RepID=UPI002A187318|nr:tetratricopeptide repeat protein [Maridesulfovibrio sp.]